MKRMMKKERKSVFSAVCNKVFLKYANCIQEESERVHALKKILFFRVPQ
jgi:hypothetical protein